MMVWDYRPLVVEYIDQMSESGSNILGFGIKNKSRLHSYPKEDQSR